MPHYYFDVADGIRDPDTQGLELADDAAARAAAARYASELLREEPCSLWDKSQWRVEVTDAGRVLLFTLVMMAFDAPPRSLAES